jgi:hypothetical protein
LAVAFRIKEACVCAVFLASAALGVEVLTIRTDSFSHRLALALAGVCVEVELRDRGISVANCWL